MRGPKKRRIWVKLTAILLAVVLVLTLAANEQQITDQITVWRFQPDPAISQMATDSGMSPRGRFIFYASQPQLNDRDEFNQNCASVETAPIILGCYSMRRIFIFNVTDERIAGVKTVTAAHEMLHAVYGRLSDGDRNDVNILLQRQLGQTRDQRILDLVALYEDAEPGQRLNELHSIFGTEVADLLPELENYYKQYFDDRSRVVAMAVQYQSVFDELQSRQSDLAKQLESIKAEINDREVAYQKVMQQLSDDIDAFNARAAQQGGFANLSEFNAARSNLLIRQDRLNNDAAMINDLVDKYNGGVNDLNALGGEYEELRSNLDSRTPATLVIQ